MLSHSSSVFAGDMRFHLFSMRSTVMCRVVVQKREFATRICHSAYSMADSGGTITEPTLTRGQIQTMWEAKRRAG
jgi:hypothetical protein